MVAGLQKQARCYSGSIFFSLFFSACDDGTRARSAQLCWISCNSRIYRVVLVGKRVYVNVRVKRLRAKFIQLLVCF